MMLEHFSRVLQVALDYIAEEFEIEPGDVKEVEIDLSSLSYYVGSVLFTEYQLEAFLSRDDSGNLGVYHINDYKNECDCSVCVAARQAETPYERRASC